MFYSTCVLTKMAEESTFIKEYLILFTSSVQWYSRNEFGLFLSEPKPEKFYVIKARAQKQNRQ